MNNSNKDIKPQDETKVKHICLWEPVVKGSVLVRCRCGKVKYDRKIRS
jgi:hypothetical protein